MPRKLEDAGRYVAFSWICNKSALCFNRDPEMKPIDTSNDVEDLVKINIKLKKKKKKKKLNALQEERKGSEDESAEEPVFKKISTEDRKVSKESTGEL